jgi:hypothetical protein
MLQASSIFLACDESVSMDNLHVETELRQPLSVSINTLSNMADSLVFLEDASGGDEVLKSNWGHARHSARLPKQPGARGSNSSRSQSNLVCDSWIVSAKCD